MMSDGNASWTSSVHVLRASQTKLVDDIQTAFEEGHRSVVAVAPCGFGKTLVLAEIARLANDHGTSTAILVHRDALLTQASRKLDDAGVAHSIIAPGRNNFGDKVQLASVQTLVRRLDRHSFGLIAVDEGHHAVASSYQKIFNANPDAHILGVTASPIRLGGQGLDAVYSKLVLGPSVQELINQGFLARPVTYGSLRKLDLSGLRTLAGDYSQHDLAALMDNNAITGDAIAHYKSICPGKPAVAFCVSVQHALDVSNDFAAAGFRSSYVSGAMPIETVRERIAGLSTGAIQVLASCDILSEGVDIPAITAAILLRPTKSVGLWIQQAGRALRPHKDKSEAIILDHANSYAKFGLIEWERDWTLEGRTKRAGGAGISAVPMKQCHICYIAFRPAPVCPGCGHVFEIEAREAQVEEGTLEKIDGAALLRARVVEEKSARTYQQLKDLARRRNYSLQWPMRKWMERGNDPRKA